MFPFFKILWHKLGSIHLTVILCLAVTLDLSIGYVCLHRHTILFSPLNDVGLADWIRTYGRHNLDHTYWFFLLLGLLTLLAINTFICTTDRVMALITRRDRFKGHRLFFKFAPHIMHYAMIIILIGYLSSYLFTHVLDRRTLIFQVPITLPGTGATLTLIDFDPLYYESDRLPAFTDWVLYPRARVRLSDGDRQKTVWIATNHPIQWKGYGIFLTNFNPKKKNGGTNRKVRIDVSIRKDPGVLLYLAGILLFTFGLSMYLSEWVFFRKGNTRPEALPTGPVEGGR